MIWLWPGDTE